MNDQLITNLEKAKARVDTFRVEAQQTLDLCARCEPILARVPAEHMWRANIDQGTLTFFFYDTDTRSELEEVKSALNAGRWEKELHHEGQSINYFATIDGLPIKLWSAPAPPSCQIVHEEVDVPAHKEIRRKLICA